MTTIDVLVAAREALILTLFLVSPFLLVAMLASLVMGLIQASTRMNDLTLSFVPRFLAVMLVVYLVAGWFGAHTTAAIERSAEAMRTVVE